MIAKLDEEIDILDKHKLFYGLTLDELSQIKTFLKKEIVRPHQAIIEEGEHSTDIYLVAKGEVSVLKWDPTNQFKLPVLDIGAGEMFGEMSFVDSSPRSSTIESKQTTILYRLSRQDLEINCHALGDIYNKILTNIARICIERLRLTNKRISSTLESSLSGLQEQFNAAQAALYFAIAMGCAKLLTFMNLPFFLGNHNFINWGFWIFLLVPAFCLIIHFNTSKKQLGLGLQNTHRALLESLGLVILSAGFLYVVKKYLPVRTMPELNMDITRAGIYLIFCIFYEFIARGFFQSNLERVFKNSTWLPPFATAVVFTLVTITSAQLEWSTISLAVLGNFVLGLLFLRNQDLISVILAHFVLGLWIILS